MEDNTETPLQPGPYLDTRGEPHVLVVDSPKHGYACLVSIDSGGDLYFGHHYSRGNLADYTPMDHWPEWWPFQDASLPERTPQVGDWVRHEDWIRGFTAEMIAGNHFGRWQLVDKYGESSSWDSLEGFTVVPAPEGLEE